MDPEAPAAKRRKYAGLPLPQPNTAAPPIIAPAPALNDVNEMEHAPEAALPWLPTASKTCELHCSLLNSLTKIYKIEYWGLLEELQGLHQQHVEEEAAEKDDRRNTAGHAGKGRIDINKLPTLRDQLGRSASDRPSRRNFGFGNHAGKEAKLDSDPMPTPFLHPVGNGPRAGPMMQEGDPVFQVAPPPNRSSSPSRQPSGEKIDDASLPPSDPLSHARLHSSHPVCPPKFPLPPMCSPPVASSSLTPVSTITARPLGHSTPLSLPYLQFHRQQSGPVGIVSASGTVLQNVQPAVSEEEIEVDVVGPTGVLSPPLGEIFSMHSSQPDSARATSESQPKLEREAHKLEGEPHELEPQHLGSNREHALYQSGMIGSGLLSMPQGKGISLGGFEPKSDLQAHGEDMHQRRAISGAEATQSRPIQGELPSTITSTPSTIRTPHKRPDNITSVVATNAAGTKGLDLSSAGLSSYSKGLDLSSVPATVKPLGMVPSLGRPHVAGGAKQPPRVAQPASKPILGDQSMHGSHVQVKLEESHGQGRGAQGGAQEGESQGRHTREARGGLQAEGRAIQGREPDERGLPKTKSAEQGGGSIAQGTEGKVLTGEKLQSESSGAVSGRVADTVGATAGITNARQGEKSERTGSPDPGDTGAALELKNITPAGHVLGTPALVPVLASEMQVDLPASDLPPGKQDGVKPEREQGAEAVDDMQVDGNFTVGMKGVKSEEGDNQPQGDSIQQGDIKDRNANGKDTNQRKEGLVGTGVHTGKGKRLRGSPGPGTAAGESGGEQQGEAAGGINLEGEEMDTEGNSCPPAAVSRPAGLHAATSSSSLQIPAMSWEAVQQLVAGHGDEVRGYGSDDEPALYSDVEDHILEGNSSGTQVFPLLQQWRRKFLDVYQDVVRLEQLAAHVAAVEMDSKDALACLLGRAGRYLIKRSTVTLGRCSDHTGAVDVDLSLEGPANKVSRQQADISCNADGVFSITNLGRRYMHVNNVLLQQGESCPLPHLSLVEVGGIRLLFSINHNATARIARRTSNMSM